MAEVRTIARMHPQIDLAAMGNLLQRTGFVLPVVDVEALTVRYAAPPGLVRDLRAAGLTSRLTPTPLLTRRSRAHRGRLLEGADPDGRIAEQFRIHLRLGAAPRPAPSRPPRQRHGVVDRRAVSPALGRLPA